MILHCVSLTWVECAGLRVRLDVAVSVNCGLHGCFRFRQDQKGEASDFWHSLSLGLEIPFRAIISVFVNTRSCTLYNAQDYVTATEEFDLEPSMRAAVYSSFYLGWLFGDPLFGWIADKWGRHPAVFGATALGFIFQAACSLAIGPYSLFTLRLIAGLCIGGADLVTYVHCIELCTIAQRAKSGSIMQIFFASGLCLSAAIAVVFPNWRQVLPTRAYPAPVVGLLL